MLLVQNVNLRVCFVWIFIYIRILCKICFWLASTKQNLLKLCQLAWHSTALTCCICSCTWLDNDKRCIQYSQLNIFHTISYYFILSYCFWGKTLIIGLKNVYCIHFGVMEGFFGYNFPKPKLIWMKPGLSVRGQCHGTHSHKKSGGNCPRGSA